MDLEETQEAQEMLLSEKTTLTNEKAVAEAQVTLLTERVEESQGTVADLGDTLSELQSTNTELERDLLESERTRTTLQNRLDSASSQLAQATGQESTLQVQLESAQLDNGSLRGQLNQKEGEISALRQTLAESQEESASVSGNWGMVGKTFFFQSPLLAGELGLAWVTIYKDWEEVLIIAQPGYASDLRNQGVPVITASKWTESGGMWTVEAELPGDTYQYFVTGSFFYGDEIDDYTWYTLNFKG